MVTIFRRGAVFRSQLPIMSGNIKAAREALAKLAKFDLEVVRYQADAGTNNGLKVLIRGISKLDKQLVSCLVMVEKLEAQKSVMDKSL